MSLLQITDPSVGGTLNGHLGRLDVQRLFINNTEIHAGVLQSSGAQVSSLATQVADISGNLTTLATQVADISANHVKNPLTANLDCANHTLRNVGRITDYKAAPPTVPFIDQTVNIDSGTLPYPALRFNSQKAGTQNKSLQLLMTDGTPTWVSSWEGYVMDEISSKCSNYIVETDNGGSIRHFASGGGYLEQRVDSSVGNMSAQLHLRDAAGGFPDSYYLSVGDDDRPQAALIQNPDHTQNQAILNCAGGVATVGDLNVYNNTRIDVNDSTQSIQLHATNTISMNTGNGVGVQIDGNGVMVQGNSATGLKPSLLLQDLGVGNRAIIDYTGADGVVVGGDVDKFTVNTPASVTLNTVLVQMNTGAGGVNILGDDPTLSLTNAGGGGAVITKRSVDGGDNLYIENNGCSIDMGTDMYLRCKDGNINIVAANSLNLSNPNSTSIDAERVEGIASNSGTIAPYVFSDEGGVDVNGEPVLVRRSGEYRWGWHGDKNEASQFLFANTVEVSVTCYAETFDHDTIFSWWVQMYNLDRGIYIGDVQGFRDGQGFTTRSFKQLPSGTYACSFCFNNVFGKLDAPDFVKDGETIQLELWCRAGDTFTLGHTRVAFTMRPLRRWNP